MSKLNINWALKLSATRFQKDRTSDKEESKEFLIGDGVEYPASISRYIIKYHLEKIMQTNPYYSNICR